MQNRIQIIIYNILIILTRLSTAFGSSNEGTAIPIGTLLCCNGESSTAMKAFLLSKAGSYKLISKS